MKLPKQFRHWCEVINLRPYRPLKYSKHQWWTLHDDFGNMYYIVEDKKVITIVAIAQTGQRHEEVLPTTRDSFIKCINQLKIYSII